VTIERIHAYVGLIGLIWGATVFVKSCRILVLEYLYFSHMRVAFPLLLVNIFTLLLSAGIGGWLATEIFNIRLAPLLATSAIFSIVLGLALQETLGNLFAGISMQFDKSYEIGDWLEIYNGSQKWVGQVEEITWRATLLIGMADELVTVSNRIMAQAQISNFSHRGKPFVRSQMFRIPYGHSPEKIRTILEKAAADCKKIRKDAPPFSLVFETTEHWMTFKLIYFIDNYGTQYIVADEVLSNAFKRLEEAGVELAGPRLQLQGTQESVQPAMA
jgi:small-conductance mechanosensitive channel